MPDGAEANRTAGVQAAISAVPQQAGRVIGEKIKQVRRLTGHEAPFLSQHASGPYKITMPAPSYVVARGFKPGVSTQIYPTRQSLIDDVVKIYQDEVRGLADQGVPYIQLDNPHYPDYIEESRRAQWREIGVEPDAAILEDIAADNACLEGIDRGHHDGCHPHLPWQWPKRLAHPGRLRADRRAGLWRPERRHLPARIRHRPLRRL